MVAMVNVTMSTIQMVYKFVQSDAYIIPIVKNHNYKYYLWLIVVAMATIVVDYM